MERVNNLSEFKSLGYLEGNFYHVNVNCIWALEEIFLKLINEDKNLRTFRKAIGYSQNMKKSLFPILMYVRDDMKILELTVKILVNLTTPVECLVPVDEFSDNTSGRRTLFELNNLLVFNKKTFMDFKITESILHYLNKMLKDEGGMYPANIENINNCLLLFRNILHIPEVGLASGKTQNQIIWNMFIQRFDRILLFLMTSSKRDSWCVAIVELLALIYKDQKTIALQKCLHNWLNLCMSENSSDNAAHKTIPPKQYKPNVYGDNSKIKKKPIRIRSLKMTELQNKELNLTSNSDEDDRHKHQKNFPEIKVPLVPKMKVKRQRITSINTNVLIQHVPTYDDVTNILKGFIVDFLLKGFGPLTKSLHCQLICGVQLHMNASFFFWLLAYFLKFAAQFKMNINFLDDVLTFEIISYLTYEGYKLYEQIQLAEKKKTINQQSCIRSLYLVITAIKEFMQIFNKYDRMSLMRDDEHLQLVQLEIHFSSTEDLRHLLVLLLTHHQPNVHSKYYLSNLVIINHILLFLNDPESEGTNFLKHIEECSTIEVMHQYGLLLQDYKTNGDSVNECIFTMLHHIRSDSNRMNLLLQPSILKAFNNIRITKFEIPKDWSELINCVVEFFKNNFKPPTKLETFQCFIDSELQNTFSEKYKGDDIQTLKEKLEKENMTNSLQWLQKVVLEACFAKLYFGDTSPNENIDYIIPTIEPIPFYGTLMKQSIPIIPWSKEQSVATHNETFLALLHCLGFHLPVDSEKLFIRIPDFWTADFTFAVAGRLGPINQLSQKFVIMPKPVSEKPKSDGGTKSDGATKSDEETKSVEKSIPTTSKESEVTTNDQSLPEVITSDLK